MNTKHINKYLKKIGITIEDILGETDAFVFGGSLVDSIINYPINDIDIIGFEKSIKDIYHYLERCGFKFENNNELEFMYKNLHWFTSRTGVLNECKIQLIQLYSCQLYENRLLWDWTIKKYRDPVLNVIKNVVGNVDIDVCGVMWNPKFGFIEACDGAIDGINNKIAKVLDDNLMHQEDRIYNRITKYIDKGFDIDHSEDIIEKGNDSSITSRYNAFKELGEIV